MDIQTLATILEVTRQLDVINVHSEDRDRMSLCINTLRKIVEKGRTPENGSSPEKQQCEVVEIPVNATTTNKEINVFSAKGAKNDNPYQPGQNVHSGLGRLPDHQSEPIADTNGGRAPDRADCT